MQQAKLIYENKKNYVLILLLWFQKHVVLPFQLILMQSEIKQHIFESIIIILYIIYIIIYPHFFKKTGSTILSSKPDIKDLNEHVASKIPHKWELFGVQVGLEQSDLDCIRMKCHDCRLLFNHLFNLWKRKIPSDFTWYNVLEVLNSKSIEEFDLAENIFRSVVLPKSTMSTLPSPIAVKQNQYPQNESIVRFSPATTPSLNSSILTSTIHVHEEREVLASTNSSFISLNFLGVYTSLSSVSKAVLKS